MSLKLQLLFYIIVGIILYLLIWRKKLVDSLSVMIAFVGFGFFSFGEAAQNNIPLHIGGVIIAIAIIVAIFQGYNSRTNK
ncbi:MAG TPA: hypothetical protein VM577_08075 [Anaerovoracaceae bacterium]|nr:hypothetical protein [Anaerovoracaceae bacterium]